MKTEITPFTTRDIDLATVLITLKFPLISIDYQIEGNHDRPIGYFNFERTTSLQEAEKDYWRGKLSVEPKTFIMNLRALKAQINGVYKNPTIDFNKFKTNSDQLLNQKI
jgi:hypothetical protein